MAHTLNPLTTFNAGAWSPSMDSRIDMPNYRKACRRLENMIPLKQGGATRRPGTQYIAKGKLGGYYVAFSKSVSRLKKFQFSPSTTFMLEFADKGIRFYSNGVQVQAATPPAWVSGQSYAYGSFVTYGGQPYYAWAGALINSVAHPDVAPAQWRLQSAYEVPSPYSGANFTAPNYWTADVFVLDFKQSNDVIYIVHPNFPVWRLTRISNAYWTMQQVQFLTPALLDQNATDTTLTAAAVTGTTTLTASAPGWFTATYYRIGNSVIQNAVTPGNPTGANVLYNCIVDHTSGTFTTDLANGLWKVVVMFQSGHIGSYWQMAYNRQSSYIQWNFTSGAGTSASMYLVGKWNLATYGTWSADISIQASYDGGTTWQQVMNTLVGRSNANFNFEGTEVAGGLYQLVISNYTGVTTAIPAMVVLTAENQFVYGLVRIDSISTAFVANITVIQPLYSTAATAFWSEGAWSDLRGYPQAITIFQERAWYAASKFQPQRIWATQTDDLENFQMFDQSQPTYGLAFDLNAPQRGPINWLNSQTDIFAGLAGAEWVISSGAPNVAITPTNISAQEQSANGSISGMPGIVMGSAVFYVVRKGSQFQQMLYSVFTNKYMSQDMQVLAQHLTGSGIKQFDFQQQFQNQSILWAVCGDGSLISMTYDMQNEIFGWAKHTTGDEIDVGFLSVQTLYGGDGQDDEVWVATYRAGATVGQLTYPVIERLNPVDWQTYNLGQPQINQAWYADCAVTSTSPATNVFAVPDILNGRTLVASINGAIAVQNIVVPSSVPYNVTIPNYSPAAGNVDVVVIGLPINWAVQPMRLDSDPQAGPTPGLTKAIQKLYVRTLNSIGGNIANRQGEIMPLPVYPITQNSGNPPGFSPNVPVDVEVDVAGLMEYETDPQFTLQGNDPLPMTVLGITVKSDIGGRA